MARKLLCYKSLFGALCLFFTISTGSAAKPATVFDAVRARGHINCGVNEGAVGLSTVDKARQWSGMNVDLCRAIASAVFGDAQKVRFIAIPSSRRFAALRDREIDVLARSTTWTLSRDIEPNIQFVGIYYHDGQAFLTRKANGITSALELTGATTCVLSGSLAEQTATSFFNRHGMHFEPVRAETWSELLRLYETKRCLVLISSRIGLASQRLGLVNGQPHLLLPEIIGPEAFGPVVLAGQSGWARVVEWTIHGLVRAEEFGVTKKTLETSLRTNDSALRNFLGIDGSVGAKLGLSKDWIANIIRDVGNYGEIFERNLGRHSKLRLPRGRNDLARNGGLMLAPAFR